MADVAKQLYRGQPGTGIGNLYGPAVAGKTIVRGIHIANTTGSVATITIGTGTTGIDTAASRFYDTVDVPAHGSLDWSGFQVIEAGEYITGKQGTLNALTVHISGVEQ